MYVLSTLKQTCVSYFNTVLVICFCFACSSLSVANLLSPGPLTKKHAMLEGTTNCAMCHQIAGDKKIAELSCLQCHSELKSRINAGRGYHAKLGKNCEKCHKEHIGREGRLIKWDLNTFNHNETGWKLEGAHEKQNCKQCHKKEGTYLGLDTKCLSCHKDQHGLDLKRACTECHSMLGWKQPAPTFDHSKTKWQLTGKHRDVQCLTCHTENRWSSLSTDCKSCHKDPHRGKFQQSCTSCHTAGGWKNITGFDHSKTGFLLSGKHRSLSCDKCHNPQLKPVLPQRTCVACHTDKHNGQLSTDCKTCHTDSSFKPSLYTIEQHNQTDFALTGKHLEKQCNLCHKENKFKFNAEEKKCNACHQDYHKKQLAQSCELCHTTAAFKPSTYTLKQHEKTQFALTGKHTQVECLKCHKENRWVFSETDRQCSACHTDPHKGQIQKPCETCHQTAAWKPSNFTIERHAATSFALTGKHVSVQCSQCHKDEKYRFTSAEKNCIGCHQDKHNGQFGQNCAQCHQTSGWKGINGVSFAHQMTRFPLDGQHRQVSCTECHKNSVFRGTPTECVYCHQVQEPHNGLLGNQCQDCHQPTRWNQLTFRHDRASFILSNKHNTIACSECHKTQLYKDTPNDCYGCHQPQYAQATNPVHNQNVFPPNLCANCHSNGGPDWRPAAFNHAAAFALNNRHAVAQCNQCHINNIYTGTSRDCYGCHQPQYAVAANPLHAEPYFPTPQCVTCHTSGGPSWTAPNYSHTSNYPLLNDHSTAPCNACHTNTQYNQTSRDCYVCHQSQYNQATNPVHNQNVFPSNQCANCHSNGGPEWRPASFNHSAAFVLNNRHAVAQCNQCHIGGVYTGTPNTCLGCHQTNYSNTTNPLHNPQFFPSAQCNTCHTDGGPNWTGATFTHTPSYVLTGKHQSPTPTACNACHSSGVYTGTTRVCFDCHASNYQSTTNPAHTPASFPTAACGSCHQVGGPGWTPSTFNHSITFPLQGRHAAATCSECHLSNQFAGTPRDCYLCHVRTNPNIYPANHQASSNVMTTNCVTCHLATDNSWTQGRLANHSWFPITSGRHRNIACAQCHTSINTTFILFDCITCHGGCANLAEDHIGVPNYSCVNERCYECHPNGDSRMNLHNLKREFRFER